MLKIPMRKTMQYNALFHVPDSCHTLKYYYMISNELNLGHLSHLRAFQFNSLLNYFSLKLFVGQNSPWLFNSRNSVERNSVLFYSRWSVVFDLDR